MVGIPDMTFKFIFEPKRLNCRHDPVLAARTAGQPRSNFKPALCLN